MISSLIHKILQLLTVPTSQYMLLKNIQITARAATTVTLVCRKKIL